MIVAGIVTTTTPNRACPFCGNADIEVDHSDDSMDAWACCNTCMACGPIVTVGCRDEEDGEIDMVAEALVAWNSVGTWE